MWKGTSNPAELFTTDEAKQMILAAKGRTGITKKSGWIEFMMVLFGLHGLRSSEIVNLKCRHIIFQQPTEKHPTPGLISIEFGKSNSSRRLIPVSDVLHKALLEYKKQKELWGESWSPDEPLLRSPSKRSQDGHYTRFAVNKAFKRVFESTQITRPGSFRPHSLRHTFLDEIADEDKSARVAQSLAGHSHVWITLQMYVHPTDKDRAEAVQNLSFWQKENE